MPEYRYVHENFDKEDETIEIPDEAIGVTTDYFGDLASVDYLLPVNGGSDS